MIQEGVDDPISGIKKRKNRRGCRSGRQKKEREAAMSFKSCSSTNSVFQQQQCGDSEKYKERIHLETENTNLKVKVKTINEELMNLKVDVRVMAVNLKKLQCENKRLRTKIQKLGKANGEAKVEIIKHMERDKDVVKIMRKEALRFSNAADIIESSNITFSPILFNDNNLSGSVLVVDEDDDGGDEGDGDGSSSGVEKLTAKRNEIISILDNLDIKIKSEHIDEENVTTQPSPQQASPPTAPASPPPAPESPPTVSKYFHHYQSSCFSTRSRPVVSEKRKLNFIVDEGVTRPLASIYTPSPRDPRIKKMFFSR
jgi:hypothetical protein